MSHEDIRMIKKKITVFFIYPPLKLPASLKNKRLSRLGRRCIDVKRESFAP
jgi:hypothetical protein